MPALTRWTQSVTISATWTSYGSTHPGELKRKRRGAILNVPEGSEHIFLYSSDTSHSFAAQTLQNNFAVIITVVGSSEISKSKVCRLVISRARHWLCISLYSKTTVYGLGGALSRRRRSTGRCTCANHDDQPCTKFCYLRWAPHTASKPQCKALD